MTITEANAMNEILRHLLRQGEAVHPSVYDAAVYLAGRADKALNAGITENQIRTQLRAEVRGL